MYQISTFMSVEVPTFLSTALVRETLLYVTSVTSAFAGEPSTATVTTKRRLESPPIVWDQEKGEVPPELLLVASRTMPVLLAVEAAGLVVPLIASDSTRIRPTPPEPPPPPVPEVLPPVPPVAVARLLPNVARLACRRTLPPAPPPPAPPREEAEVPAAPSAVMVPVDVTVIELAAMMMMPPPSPPAPPLTGPLSWPPPPPPPEPKKILVNPTFP